MLYLAVSAQYHRNTLEMLSHLVLNTLLVVYVSLWYADVAQGRNQSGILRYGYGSWGGPQAELKVLRQVV